MKSLDFAGNPVIFPPFIRCKHYPECSYGVSVLTRMALFEACAKQFVKDTGRSTLFPVLDLNSSSHCDILCVVTKKRSRWFWKSDKYKTTPFSLNELLTKVSRRKFKLRFVALGSGNLSL